MVQQNTIERVEQSQMQNGQCPGPQKADLLTKWRQTVYADDKLEGSCTERKQIASIAVHTKQDNL